MKPKTQLCPCCGKIMSADYDYDSYDGWFYTCLNNSCPSNKDNIIGYILTH